MAAYEWRDFRCVKKEKIGSVNVETWVISSFINRLKSNKGLVNSRSWLFIHLKREGKEMMRCSLLKKRLIKLKIKFF